MIILDSGFLIALKVLNDVHHQKAVSLMKDIADGAYGKPVISDYIFDETVTGIFTRSKNLKLAVEFGNELLKSLFMVYVEDDTFSEAWSVFRKQGSASLSFTDSTIISAMHVNGIRNIATFDSDFGKIKGVNAIGL